MCHIPPGTENRVYARAVGGGGGGCSAYYGINRGRGASKGAMGDAAGEGGHDGTTTLAANPGGGGTTGQTPWRHPPGRLNWSGVDPPLSSSRACLTTFIAISVP